MKPVARAGNRAASPGPRENAMAKAEPPLSPHIQIYRWYFTMALSIAHRATGIAMAVGLLLLAWWLLALAVGPESFGAVEALVDSWFGALVLFGYTPILFFHMGNGVRHLVWDVGYGFDPDVARQSGTAVLIFAGIMTVVVWLVVVIV
jgi:succinate dehydrogenase / fumarate reductase cytochrome b subunit